MTITLEKRIQIERQIVNAIFELAQKYGYKIILDNGEDKSKHFTAETAMKVVMATDIEQIRLYRNDDHTWTYIGFIDLVYGNEGWTVVSDYSSHLHDWLEPINKLAEKIENDIYNE